MKSVYLIVASLLLIAAGTRAFADGNGVERGDIQINFNAGVPRGVEDQIETTLFAYCDLRGAAAVSTTYLQTSHDDDSNSNKYEVQLAVTFKDARTVVVNAVALLHLDGAVGDRAIEIREFKSPICRDFP
jgi:hypothetical protein